ncbi:ATP-binding cassette domain-containing protein [Roseospira navarrensis]|uniref:ATP-binding cassette domain-containing protein n=1 Tax=Roseospira navarrensis TaxID=140058 RepID=A0A7X1ZBI4_9PROT|nr:ABC transporter ATP-binding protein [Roseospira navarrensis]MQX35313.1 ATP-binding cassette domain-containing protein [Roseospira navarrensis]
MSRLPNLLADGRGRQVGVVAALALAQAVATGIAAFATRDAFAALRAGDSALPWWPLLAITGAGVMVAAARIAERSVAERLGQDYAMALRVRLFDHLSRMGAGDIARLRTGALSMRFVGDLAAVRNWLSRGLTRLVSAIIVLPASAAILYLLSPPLALAAALPIAAGLLLMTVAARPLGLAHRRLRARRARLAARMTERLPHAPELRLLGRQGIERDHLRKRGRALMDAAVRRTRLAEMLRAIPDAVAGTAAAGVLLAGWVHTLPTPEIAAGLAVVSLMVLPMRDLGGVWDRRRAWCAAREKCETLLARRRLASGPRNRLDGEPARPRSIRFQDVRPGGHAPITVTAEAGEKIAILGGNGSGKTTLLHLAAGLEHAGSSRVLLDGVPVSSLGAAARRRALMLLSTRPPILAGSLRRALTLGLNPRPDDARVLAVAETYGLSAVVARPGGLDGTLAEAGRNLSCGEAQRLLLARAALSEVGVLLLDEPETGLDTDGETLVADLIRRSSATVLFTTHSPSLVSIADRVWRLDADGLVACAPDPHHGPAPAPGRRAGG